MLPVPGMLEEIELQSYGAEEMEYVCQCLQKNTSVTWGKKHILIYFIVWNIHQKNQGLQEYLSDLSISRPNELPNSLWGDTIERFDEPHWRCGSETRGQHVVSKPETAIGTLPG